VKRLDTRFPVEPFDSTPRLLMASTAVYLGNLPRIAAVTLLVFLPVKFLLQVLYPAFGMPENGAAPVIASALSDGALNALVTPAVVFILVTRLRTGRGGSISKALSWGGWLYSRSLWTQIRASVIIMLRLLLIIVPGVIAGVRLAFTDIVVGVEAYQTDDPLARSRQLSAGHMWQIFLTLLTLGVLDLLIWGGLLRLGLGMAITDSLMAVIGQWSTAAMLLLYLGITQASAPLSDRAARPDSSRPSR
jgi:hypothetical protein